MKFCKKCGTQLSDEDIFCKKCGTKCDCVPAPCDSNEDKDAKQEPKPQLMESVVLKESADADQNNAEVNGRKTEIQPDVTRLETVANDAELEKNGAKGNKVEYVAKKAQTQNAVAEDSPTEKKFPVAVIIIAAIVVTGVIVFIVAKNGKNSSEVSTSGGTIIESQVETEPLISLEEKPSEKTETKAANEKELKETDAVEKETVLETVNVDNTGDGAAFEGSWTNWNGEDIEIVKSGDGYVVSYEDRYANTEGPQYADIQCNVVDGKLMCNDGKGYLFITQDYDQAVNTPVGEGASLVLASMEYPISENSAPFLVWVRYEKNNENAAVEELYKKEAILRQALNVPQDADVTMETYEPVGSEVYVAFNKDEERVAGAFFDYTTLEPTREIFMYEHSEKRNKNPNELMYIGCAGGAEVGGGFYYYDGDENYDMAVLDICPDILTSAPDDLVARCYNAVAQCTNGRIQIRVGKDNDGWDYYGLYLPDDKLFFCIWWGDTIGMEVFAQEGYNQKVLDRYERLFPGGI